MKHKVMWITLGIFGIAAAVGAVAWYKLNKSFSEIDMDIDTIDWDI